MLVVGITLVDFIVSLFYVILILGIAYTLKPKTFNTYNKYFFPFIFAKIGFAVIFVLIHSYYYKGGDTFLYFAGGNFFRDQFIANPQNYLSLLFSSFDELKNIYYNESYAVFYAFKSQDVFFMSKILSLFNLITGGNFLASSILFTMVSAVGIWKLFKTLCLLYPTLAKYFAIGILFYPSLGIWGSGILKDPLTLACVGIIFSASYNLTKRKNITPSVILILGSIFLCQVLKPYILYTFVPVMLLWTQGKISQNLNSSLIKIMITPIILSVFVIGGIFFLQNVSEGAGKYSIENVQSVAEGFNSWHTYLAETRDQSGYSLGNVEFTPAGIIQKAPEAFFVSYYRPFIIGDVRNLATLFEAIQTLILLVLTIYIFFKVSFIKFFKLLISNPEIRAFLIYSILFGIAIGLTSYNFGALSRYKTPSLPFYVAFLIITYYEGYLKKKIMVQNQGQLK